MEESQVFTDEEIKKFAAHLYTEEYNQFAYIIIDKAFNLHPENERIYFREKCLNSMEPILAKMKIPTEIAEEQKPKLAAMFASQLLTSINKMIENGEFVMPSD